MRPVTVSVGPLASALPNNIALSQTPAGAVALTLNGALVVGGVAILDTPRRILLTTTGADAGKTLTIVGTDVNNSPLTEILVAVSTGTSYTNTDFKTVTSITASAAYLAAITVGTNGVASSMWVRMDEYANAQSVIQCIVNGTVNYSVQQTMQDPNSPTNPIAPYLVNWANSSDASVVNATNSAFSAFPYTPSWVKITLNSGTGSVSATVAQAGNAPY